LNNPQRRGRPRQAGSELQVELPWIEGVLCQRFSPSRGGGADGLRLVAKQPLTLAWGSRAKPLLVILRHSLN
jgi:hypothetical protein